MRRMFSEKQLQETAIKGLENADVKVKTIEQSEPNEEYDFKLPEITGLTWSTNGYTKIKRINGFLILILATQVITDADYTTQSNINLSFELSSELSSRIFRLDGTSCDVNVSSNSNICGNAYIVSGASKYCALTSSYANKFNLNLYNSGISANQTFTFDMRLIIAIV